MGISFERIESNTNSPQRELTSVEKEWATDEFWTTPKWLTTKGNYSQLNDYESYLRYHLQVRYLENQEDFRTAYNNFATTKGFDTVTASRIVELLKTAKFALEENTTNLLNVANLLDLAQRFIIWLFPYHVVSSKINILLQQIPNSNQEYSLLLTERLKLYDNYAHLGELRATYDEIVGALNKITIQNHISYGLQIKRLQILRYWGFIVLIFCLIILPFSLNIKETGYLSSINTVILPSLKPHSNPSLQIGLYHFYSLLLGA